MANFPTAWLDELRDRADIVSVVGEYVTLSQKGKNFWGLCPFHGEKTPSFSVNPQQQFYYCFGCKAGGSVIQFVMEMERMEFPEAVRHLAERVHLPLPEFTRQDPEAIRAARTLKEQIYAANTQAARFFHGQLWQPENAGMLRYLYDRGMDDITIRRFGIGATAQGWDALYAHLTGLGFPLDVLKQAGIVVSRDERIYDMFRQRVIFPILNAQGQVLGFGGRAMGDVQPKYLNTSDTPVFNKRLGVYGIHLLKKQRNLPRVLLVEGYMDVVSLSRYGVPGVVATLGTALTEEQARLLKRYAPQVYVAYDGDSAGQNATLRALDILEAAEVLARVLVIPDGQDPDEYINTHGLEAFEALAPMLPVLYRMRRAQEKHDMSTQEGRTQYAIDAAALIAKVPEPVERENCLRQLMLETGFEREVLLEQVASSPGAAPQGGERPRRRLQTQKPKPQEEQTRWQKTLLYLMAGGLISPDLVRPEDFDTPLYKRLFEAMFSGAKPAALLESAVDEQERIEIHEVLKMEPEGAEEFALEIAAGCLRGIRLSRLNRKIEALSAQAQTAEAAEKAQIYQEILALTQEKKQLETGRKEG